MRVMRFLSLRASVPAVSASRKVYGLALVGVVALAGGLLPAAGAASSSAVAPDLAPLVTYWDGSSWTQQAAPNPDGWGSLAAVTALSATDVWAVGSYGIEGQDGKALAEHWDGASWQQVTMPTPTKAVEVRFYAMAAVSATDVWAVGAWAGASTRHAFWTLIEHWDGNSWTIVPSPSPGNSAEITGVAALSKTNAWAVGTYERLVRSIGQSRTLVLHWNGKSWKRVASPNPGTGFAELSGVAAVSPRDVWAVGTYYSKHHSQRTLTVHWNGKKWKQVPSPNRGVASQLLAAAAVGPKSVWAVGYFNKYGGGRGGLCLVEHWNGHSWRVVAPAARTGQARLNSLAVLAGNDIWAAGLLGLGPGPYSPLSEHWNGHTWSLVHSPNPAVYTNWFSGIAGVTPTAVWAVGTSSLG